MKRLFGNESWIEAVAPSHNSDFSNLDLTLTFDFDLDLDSGLIIIPYYSHYRLQQSNALLPLHAHGAGGHLGGERPIRGQYPGHVICVDQSGVRNEDP